VDLGFLVRGTAASTAMLLYAPLVLATDIHLEAEHRGEEFIIRARARMEVPLDTAWQVVTDYASLVQFIPDMLDSKVVRRDGNHAVVVQSGKIRFLIFTRTIQVTLEVDELPYERVRSHAIAGDFKQMEGTYELERLPAGVELRYEGHIIPGFFIPPMVGTLVVKRVIEGQFRAMVQETLRRAKQ
jgi:ribosome-associated toxin RatA of RatAB toxin-antitoxin module